MMAVRARVDEKETALVRTSPLVRRFHPSELRGANTATSAKRRRSPQVRRPMRKSPDERSGTGTCSRRRGGPGCEAKRFGGVGTGAGEAARRSGGRPEASRGRAVRGERPRRVGTAEAEKGRSDGRVRRGVTLGKVDPTLRSKRVHAKGTAGRHARRGRGGAGGAQRRWRKGGAGGGRRRRGAAERGDASALVSDYREHRGAPSALSSSAPRPVAR